MAFLFASVPPVWLAQWQSQRPQATLPMCHLMSDMGSRAHFILKELLTLWELTERPT